LLKDKVQPALDAIEKSLSSAIILFDGSYCKDNDLLDSRLLKKLEQKTGDTKGKKKGKGKKGKRQQQESDSEEEEDDDEIEEEEGIKNHEAQILLEEDGLLLKDAFTDTIHARMRMSGRLAFAAAVDAGATVAEAGAAVRQDIVRSLRARVRMHCDSLVGEETSGSEMANAPVLHEPPRRVLVQLPACPEGVAASDYLFPGETPYDSNDSVEEILGFKPSIAAFDDEIELVAGPLETKETLTVSLELA